MIFTNQHPRDMRRNDPDEANRAGKGNGHTRENRDTDEGADTQGFYANTECACPLVTQSQSGQAP